jgi:hypothetical protein
VLAQPVCLSTPRHARLPARDTRWLPNHGQAGDAPVAAGNLNGNCPALETSTTPLRHHHGMCRISLCNHFKMIWRQFQHLISFHGKLTRGHLSDIQHREKPWQHRMQSCEDDNVGRRVLGGADHCEYGFRNILSYSKHMRMLQHGEGPCEDLLLIPHPFILLSMQQRYTDMSDGEWWWGDKPWVCCMSGT